MTVRAGGTCATMRVCGTPVPSEPEAVVTDTGVAHVPLARGHGGRRHLAPGGVRVVPGVDPGAGPARPRLGALPLGLAGAALVVLGASLDLYWVSTACLGAGGGLLVESAYLALRGHALGRRPPGPGA